MLTTERLLLRRFAWGDLDDVVALHNDAEVMHYVNNGAPVAQADVANEVGDWVLRSGSKDPADIGFVAAIERSTGVFLGWLHLCARNGVVDSGLELGFRLRRAVWGCGYATEGSRALIDDAFARSDFDRVYGRTMLVHHASRRVMEKAGLRLVGVFATDWPVRIPGDERGDVEYELTRSRWETDRSARCRR